MKLHRIKMLLLLHEYTLKRKRKKKKMSQDWDSVTWRPTKKQSPTTKRTLRARYFDDILLLCWSYALTTVLFCGVANLEWQTLHSTIPLFINSTTSPHQYYIYSTQSFQKSQQQQQMELWKYLNTSDKMRSQSYSESKR